VNGADRYLRPFNAASKKIQRNVQSQCEQGLGVSSTGSVIYSDPAGDITDVKLYVKDDATGDKWYLRVHFLTHAVSLECQSALDNVSHHNKCHYISKLHYNFFFYRLPDSERESLNLISSQWTHQDCEVGP